MEIVIHFISFIRMDADWQRELSVKGQYGVCLGVRVSSGVISYYF